MRLQGATPGVPQVDQRTIRVFHCFTPTEPLTERPFGLPKVIHLQDYNDNPVLRLGKFNYKLPVSAGRALNKKSPVLSVMDTGAGPNLIARHALPELPSMTYNTSRVIENLHDANGRPLRTRGTVQLFVTIAGYSCRVTFVAVDRLSVDFILRCDFIDRHVLAIYPGKQKILLQNGAQVGILRRPAEEGVEHKDNPAPLRGDHGKPPGYRKIWVAKSTHLPPGVEIGVLVRAEDAGIFFMQPDERLFRTQEFL